MDFDSVERFELLFPEDEHSLVSCVCASDFDLARARIKELEEKGGRLAIALGNLLIHIHELGLRKSVGIYGNLNYRNARAESAEQKLATVLKLAEEGLPELSVAEEDEENGYASFQKLRRDGQDDPPPVVSFGTIIGCRERQFLSRMAEIREAVK